MGKWVFWEVLREETGLPRGVRSLRHGPDGPLFKERADCPFLMLTRATPTWSHLHSPLCPRIQSLSVHWTLQLWVNNDNATQMAFIKKAMVLID